MTPPKHDHHIISMDVEQAADTVLKAPYGMHALIIYTDMMTLRQFWSFYAKKSIEEKNELLYLAPFYETVDSVRKTLSEGHVSIDVHKYEQDEKSLIIVDSLDNYIDASGSALDAKSLSKGFQHLVRRAKHLEKSGVSILGDMGAFLFTNQIQGLADYELDLPSSYNINLKGLCMYHQKDFDRMPEDSKKKIIEHHQISIKI